LNSIDDFFRNTKIFDCNSTNITRRKLPKFVSILHLNRWKKRIQQKKTWQDKECERVFTESVCHVLEKYKSLFEDTNSSTNHNSLSGRCTFPHFSVQPTKYHNVHKNQYKNIISIRKERRMKNEEWRGRISWIVNWQFVGFVLHEAKRGEATRKC
jgi:hypothetical protein